jgi:glycosyltransferase 2 family protein
MKRDFRGLQGKVRLTFEKKSVAKQYVWPLVQWVAFAAIMWLVVSYLRRYWHEISSIELRFNWFWGSLTAILVLLSNAMQISLFRYFLQHNGLSLGFLAAWRVFCAQQIGKYIPGKVAGIAALTYMLKEAGLSAHHSFAAVFIYNIASLLSSLLVGLLALPAWAPHTNRVVVTSFIAIAILGTAAVCTHSFWRLMNLGLARFRRPPLPSYPSRTAMALLMLGLILYWLILGTTMFTASRFFIDVQSKWFPLAVPAFSLACFISNISFIAPAGFGVREALLIGIIGGSNAFGTVFAATSRIVMILNDVIIIGGAWLFGPSKVRAEVRCDD